MLYYFFLRKLLESVQIKFYLFNVNLYAEAMGHGAFQILTAPLPTRGGGGGGIGFFLQRSCQKLDHPDSFFKGATKNSTPLIVFFKGC